MRSAHVSPFVCSAAHKFGVKTAKLSKEASSALVPFRARPHSKMHRFGADRRQQQAPPPPVARAAPGWQGSRAPGEGVEGAHLISRESIHFKVDPVEREIKATTTDAIGRCFNLRHQSERASPPVCRPRPAGRPGSQRLKCRTRCVASAAAAATLSAPVPMPMRGPAPATASARRRLRPTRALINLGF